MDHQTGRLQLRRHIRQFELQGLKIFDFTAKLLAFAHIGLAASMPPAPPSRQARFDRPPVKPC